MPGFLGAASSSTAAPFSRDERRFTESAETVDGIVSLAGFRSWFASWARAHRFSVSPIPFDRLNGWSFQPGTGNLIHRSGRFFSIEGLEVRVQSGDLATWHQPVICQPEVGILGLLAREFDGVLHFLVQAKMEPGNINGWQLSPTVQATRSNYSRVHGGGSVPYLEHFLGPQRGRVLLDVLQSEQGAWFLRKRNRNMIVETSEQVPVRDGFCWLTLGQLHQLLQEPNLVNMDTRTVLSGVKYAAPLRPGHGTGRPRRTAPAFRASLCRSLDPDQPSRHSFAEVLGWLNDVKTRRELKQIQLPLGGLPGWHQDSERLARADGRGFTVMAAHVQAARREVACWSQPLIAPGTSGTAAFLVCAVNGVMHVLVHARTEAGTFDVAEIAPTVQVYPGETGADDDVSAELLASAVGDDQSRIVYDALQSEEGGRFWQAVNRYLVTELPVGADAWELDGYIWVTLRQLTDLVQHSNYLNVEARTLLACLHALW